MSVSGMPDTLDHFAGPDLEDDFAAVHARLGDTDSALVWLAHVLNEPSPTSRAYVRLDPDFASLRNDSRFQKLVAGP